MNAQLVVVTVLALCIAPAPAWADWRPDDPAKWAQLPDPNGWDVNITSVRILADDFPCSETGWITDIHFWGSWKSDDVSTIDKIFLSIYADVPAGQDPDARHSHPGDRLWLREIDPATYGGLSIKEWGTGEQGWYDPAYTVPEVIPDDHSGIWQVNVSLDRQDWFLQEGTAAEPIVYWLGISVYFPGTDAKFGWKTSLDHWNDDAVSGLWFGPHHGGPAWGQELLDPITGETLDLAFVITGIPIPEPGILALSGLGLLVLLRRTK